MAGERWTIIAVADDGDEARIEESKDGELRRLLREAVRRLYGEGHDVDKYELVIGGVVQQDLEVTLEQAGLHDGSEVVVQPRDVSRG
jgi:hypothetical protein